MSKNQKTVTKSYTYFDLSTGQRVSVDKEIPPFVPKTAEEVAAILNEDNSILTAAVNAYLKRKALREVKLEVAALGGSSTVVMALAKPFRAMPPFNSYFEMENGKPALDKDGEKVIDRKKQTAEILKFIWSNPALVESIKQASLEAADTDEDDTTEDPAE